MQVVNQLGGICANPQETPDLTSQLLSYTMAGTNHKVSTAVVVLHYPRGKIMKWTFVFVSAFVFFLLLMNPGCTKQDIVFRYAHAQNESDPRSLSMKFFKQELERRTNGRIRVEHYFGGVLGTERELADAVAIGALQGTRGGMFEDASIKFNIVMLPFLVDNWEQAMRLVRSPWMMEVAKEGRKNNFHIPAVGISQGFRAHGCNKRPIKTLEDFAGLKIRVPDAQEVLYRLEDALGSNPQGIAQAETYSALRTGVVEGSTAPPSDFWDRRQYEVLDWITIDAHATGPDPLMVNLVWYEKLPDDLKKIFDEVAGEAMRYSDDLYSKSEEKIIARLGEEVEIIRLGPEVIARMREKTKPVYDFFVNRGDFTWDDINAAISAAKMSDS
jgi:C4-dicarboxylate-binding protein DctP